MRSMRSTMPRKRTARSSARGTATGSPSKPKRCSAANGRAACSLAPGAVVGQQGVQVAQEGATVLAPEQVPSGEAARHVADGFLVEQLGEAPAVLRPPRIGGRRLLARAGGRGPRAGSGRGWRGGGCPCRGATGAGRPRGSRRRPRRGRSGRSSAAGRRPTPRAGWWTRAGRGRRGRHRPAVEVAVVLGELWRCAGPAAGGRPARRRVGGQRAGRRPATCRRCSWAVAGKAVAATPAPKEATCSTHGAWSWSTSWDHTRAPVRAPTTSRSHRDARCSVDRRRSPRGQQSTTWVPAAARTARSWWCCHDGASAASGEGPPARTRSWSGRSASSAGRVGERALGQAEHDHDVEVLAEGQPDRADEHAVAEAADPAEVGVELQLQRAAEPLHRGDGVDAVEPAEAVEGGDDLVVGHAFGLGPGGPGTGRRRGSARPGPAPTQPVLARWLGLEARRAARSRTNARRSSASAARRRARRRTAAPSSAGSAGPAGSAPARCRPAAKRTRRSSHCRMPATTPASRDASPRRRRDRLSAGADEGRAGQQGEQVVPADVGRAGPGGRARPGRRPAPAAGRWPAPLYGRPAPASSSPHSRP